MTCTHDWARWMKGNRTGIWMRHCYKCTTVMHSVEKPDLVQVTRKTEQRVEQRYEKPEFDQSIRGRMEKLVQRRFVNKVAPDWRQKRSGE